VEPKADGDANTIVFSHQIYLYPLLDKYVFVPNFDAASDALTTVREVFTNDKSIASEYLDRDYNSVFQKYNLMLQHDSYVTKRMSLKLLGEILLDRSNFHVMIKYISSRDNLRIIMLLLRDSSGNIQFEAFHVFKIFVANPNKPPEVVKILVQNKVKLVAYLDQFHKEKEEGDEQFRDEKALLISTLHGLEET
jgi:calcium binding protein 39